MRLNELVKKAGSQAALASQLDCTPGFISQLLTGRRPITEKTARKLERRLKLPHEWMDVFEPLPLSQLQEPASSYTTRTHELGELTQADIDIVLGYRSLSDEVRTSVWDLIDGYLRRKNPALAAVLGPRNVTHSKRAEARLVTRQIIKQAEANERTKQKKERGRQ